MIEKHALDEAELNRQCLRRISHEKSTLHRVVHVLGLVAHNSIGLGEVLQDYARQACSQLQALMRAAEHVAAGGGDGQDAQALQSAYFTLKIVRSVLEMTPAAMERNKAGTIGDKEHFSRLDIMDILQALSHSTDIARLLAGEDSGEVFAALVSLEKIAVVPVSETMPPSAVAAGN